MKVLMIRLVCEKLNIDQNGRIIIEREKLPKKQNKKQEFLKNDYFKTLLVRLELQNLEAYFVVGSNGNASGLSIFTGALLSGMTMLCSLLKNKYGRMKVVTNVQTIYTQDVGEVSLGFTIRFSLMDMIKSKLFAYKDYNKIKREVKNGQ